VDAVPSGQVDGEAHEVQAQINIAVSRLVQQLTTDRRPFLRILRYLVAAQVKHPQRLNVLHTPTVTAITLETRSI